MGLFAPFANIKLDSYAADPSASFAQSGMGQHLHYFPEGVVHVGEDCMILDDVLVGWAFAQKCFFSVNLFLA
mgnify:CR=1 FL=1